jgi:hypothetical protein
MHCKERHHTEGAKGLGQDKPKSTKAQSLTKRYYHRTNVGAGSPKAEGALHGPPSGQVNFAVKEQLSTPGVVVESFKTTCTLLPIFLNILKSFFFSMPYFTLGSILSLNNLQKNEMIFL